MAMGNRPEVKTAPRPIVALDVSLLAAHFGAALARVPLRRPFAGDSSVLSNLGTPSPGRSSAPSWATPRRYASPSSGRSSWCSTTSARGSCLPSSAPSTSWAARRISAACPGSSTCRATRRPRGSCSTCTVVATSAPRRTCTRSSRRRCAGRPGAPSSSPTTAWPRSSPTRPQRRTPPPFTRR